ncbi:hypothetical protein BKA61DRAFT_622066 [Leptodontidium sp. MPI-SDFR-AT-0119]|nr:hypothetical protein BKA61DRAFT_622066 [Leptodontidium sp. MPI-SDFR-AT-0119]
MRLKSKRCTFIRLLSTGTIIHIPFIAGCGNAALIVPQNVRSFVSIQDASLISRVCAIFVALDIPTHATEATGSFLEMMTFL